MIDEFNKAWAEYESELENEIEEKINEQECERYFDFRYSDLIEIIVDKVINPYVIKNGMESKYISNGLDKEKITEIDNGDYQGVLLYLIPIKTYQPTHEEYIVTYVYYGSCSGCDTLLAAENASDIKSLCLHLLQNMKWLYE